MEAHQDGGIHRAGRHGRRRRSDGPHDPGHRSKAQPHGAVAGRREQGRRIGRRRLPGHEGLCGQSAQDHHHPLQPVHDSAGYRDSLQLGGSDARRHAGARRVRAVGERRISPQDGTGIYRCRQGRRRRVRHGRHRLQAGGPDHYGRPGAGDRREAQIHLRKRAAATSPRRWSAITSIRR